MEPRRPFRISLQSLMNLIAVLAICFMPFVHRARQVEHERMRVEQALREVLEADAVVQAARNEEVRAQLPVKAARNGTQPAKREPRVGITQPPE